MNCATCGQERDHRLIYRCTAMVPPNTYKRSITRCEKMTFERGGYCVFHRIDEVRK